MPEISVRGLEMPSSPIRKLTPLANDAKARGVKVYHLNIGQPDLPTPQKALDSLKTVDRSVLEYSPSPGFQSLREKLAKYYHKFNIDLSADEVIVTSGGSEAVLFAFLACLNPVANGGLLLLRLLLRIGLCRCGADSNYRTQQNDNYLGDKLNHKNHFAYAHMRCVHAINRAKL